MLPETRSGDLGLGGFGGQICLGGSLGGGDVVGGGVRLIGSGVTSYGGDHQSEHEKRNQKKLLYAVLLDTIFFLRTRRQRALKHIAEGGQEQRGIMLIR
jgi:hypothetical protein